MARKSRPVLPGLSRSTKCSSTCGRLAGHKGDHRPELHAVTKSPVATVKAAVAAPAEPILQTLTYKGRTYRLEEAVPAPKARKAARRPRRSAPQCRVQRDGIRCGRAYGHKAAGKRHSFAGRVVVLPTVEADRTQLIGHARRAKAAPQGTQRKLTDR